MRCEDFPCCGHYDEADPGNTWCPDENGVFPPLMRRPDRSYYGDDDWGYEAMPDDDNYEREEGWCTDYDEEHDFYFNTSCGAKVCTECGWHDGLARCYCGFSASGENGARELEEMGENLDEDW